MPDLAWYWWVLIALVIVVGGYFKLKVLNKMFAKKNDTIDE